MCAPTGGIAKYFGWWRECGGGEELSRCWGGGEGVVEAQGGEAALYLGRCVGFCRLGEYRQLLGGEGEGVEALGVPVEHVAHGRQHRRGQGDAQAPALGAGPAAEQA